MYQDEVMPDWFPPVLVPPLIALVVGGVLIAILNFRFSRKNADDIMDASFGHLFFLIFFGGLIGGLPLYLCALGNGCLDRDDFWAMPPLFIFGFSALGLA